MHSQDSEMCIENLGRMPIAIKGLLLSESLLEHILLKLRSVAKSSWRLVGT